MKRSRAVRSKRPWCRTRRVRTVDIMKRSIGIIISAAALLLTASCGDGDSSSSSSEGPQTTPAPATSTSAMSTTSEPGSTTSAAPTTTAVVHLEQTAIWPAAGVVFATPEEAAADFVTTVLGVPATLGEFRQADQRSGELDVLSPGEGQGATPVVRGTLVLRRLDPDDGWFILSAANANASITTPAALAEVAAGLLTVAGMARGFEANVVVTAFEAGDVDSLFDQAVTMAGAQQTPEPYEVTLDLTGVPAGATVVVLVQGGAGLETDPGDFGAIAVTVAG